MGEDPATPFAPQQQQQQQQCEQQQPHQQQSRDAKRRLGLGRRRLAPQGNDASARRPFGYIRIHPLIPSKFESMN